MKQPIEVNIIDKSYIFMWISKSYHKILIWNHFVLTITNNKKYKSRIRSMKNPLDRKKT